MNGYGMQGSMQGGMQGYGMQGYGASYGGQMGGGYGGQGYGGQMGEYGNGAPYGGRGEASREVHTAWFHPTPGSSEHRHARCHQG